MPKHELVLKLDMNKFWK